MVANVLMAVAECLPRSVLNDLATMMPPELMVYLRRTGQEPDPLFDSQLFLGWVVSTVDATGARDKTGGGLDLYSAYSGDKAIRRHQCGALLVGRYGYTILEYHVTGEGTCPDCGTKLPGIWWSE